ncbi:MAG: molybdopterin molybdenumtransferase MoeA [Nitrospirae bacterium RBG_13_39_12]|nr:MAG: molybdopterin molybdenumtransferase MoeA [Nitrospirae bacterium RBG_13_39_12]
MLGREELITVDKALEILEKHIYFRKSAEIKLAIENSYGMIVSKDIFSPENLPEFNRSTVDGFAVNSADTFGATDNLPSYLVLKAEILMGEEPDFKVDKGEVAKIATGGMLPQGTDSVVMLEHTQLIDEKMIEVVKPVAPGENVIQAGEDAKKGEFLLESGRRLRPQDIGALAGLGITNVWVYEKPKVSIISTGDEIIPANKPIKPGYVRDINSYVLSGLILNAGGIPVKKGIFSDEYDILKDVVEESLSNSDMVLITGGSSVGTKDMTARIINDAGKPGVLFHGVSLKPGKPLICGIVNNKVIWGLPGHPAAVSVCFKIFIEPVLKTLSGLKEDRLEPYKKTVTAKIDKNISSSPGREEHIAVYLEERNGELWATPIFAKSGLITTLIKADGTALIPLKKLGVKEGETVEVRLF